MKLYITALAALVFATNASAGLYDELNAEEQAAIQNGEQVTHTRDIEGSVWPEITVYQKTEASAEEAAAVFFDYEHHKDFFSDMPKSTISARPNKTTVEVDYTMTFPPMLGIQLKPENYTTRDQVSAPDTNTFLVSWKKVRADTIKDFGGSMQFEPLGSGALIRYVNFISPPRPSLAQAIVDKAIEKTERTLSELITQIMEERSSTPDVLTKQIGTLRGALGR